MTAAAIYRGEVRHRRLRDDASADFTHPLSMVYVELSALHEAAGGRLNRPWPGLLRVRPRDLHGRHRTVGALAAELRRTVADHTGRPAPEGRIGVLTQPRVAGLCFNPVSFYYLYDAAGELDAVVAEVTNTPWRERHAYVLREAREGRRGEPLAAASPAAEPDAPARRTSAGGLAGEHPKAMRVSPFQPLGQRYRWTVGVPGERLTVAIVNHAAATDAVELAASLELRREPLTRASLRRLMRRQPAGTLRTLGLIYAHAVALKVRGARVHTTPKSPVARGGEA